MRWGQDDPSRMTTMMEKEIMDGITVQELILPAAILGLVLLVKTLKSKRSEQIERARSK